MQYLFFSVLERIIYSDIIANVKFFENMYMYYRKNYFI